MTHQVRLNAHGFVEDGGAFIEMAGYLFRISWKSLHIHDA